MAFDPDAYLKAKMAPPAQEFDPDAYLQQKVAKPVAAATGLPAEFPSDQQLAQDRHDYDLTRGTTSATQKPNDNSYERPVDMAKRLGKAYLGGGAVPSALVGAARNPILNKVFPPLTAMQLMDDVSNVAFSGKPISQIAQESPSNPNNINLDFGKQLEQFKQDTAKHAGTMDQWKAGSPIMSLIGSIPKNYVEFAGGEGLLNASKIPGVAAAAGKPAGFIQKLMEGLKTANRAGILNAGISQLDKPELSAERIGTDYVLGGAMEGGVQLGTGAYQGAKKFLTSEKLRPAIESYIPLMGKYIKSNREIEEGALKRGYEEAFDGFKKAEVARKGEHESGIYDLMSKFDKQEATRRGEHVLSQRNAVEDFKGLIKKDPVDAANDLLKQIREENRLLGQNYEQVVPPIMKKYGSAPVKAERLAEDINKTLDNLGALDAEGNISTEGFISPETIGLVNKLAKIKSSIAKGMDINELNTITKQLKAEAKSFTKSAGDRSGAQNSLARLSETSRNEMLDALKQAAPKEEYAAVKEARSQYAQKKPLIRQAQKLDKLPPDRLSVNLRSKLPGSVADELISKFPQTRENIAESFLNMLTQHSTSPRKFTKEIEYYGRDRLKKILGEEGYRALESAEKNLHQTSMPWSSLKAQKPVPIPFKPGTAPARPGPYRGGIEEITDWFKEAFDDNAPRSAIKRLMRNLGKKGMQAPRGIKYLLPEREDLTK